MAGQGVLRGILRAVFRRREGGNAQGVNVRLHQVGERAIHQLVPLQCAQPLEFAGDDADAKVASAVARSGVPGVQMAVVDQLDDLRVQGVAKLGADAFGSVHLSDLVMFSSWLSTLGGQPAFGESLGIFDASQAPCASANANVRPRTPKTLNLAQVSVLKVYMT